MRSGSLVGKRPGKPRYRDVTVTRALLCERTTYPLASLGPGVEQRRLTQRLRIERDLNGGAIPFVAGRHVEDDRQSRHDGRIRIGTRLFTLAPAPAHAAGQSPRGPGLRPG